MNGAGNERAPPRVTLVNTNRIHPPVAPIAFDYLHGPLAGAGFEPRVLDLCFEEDWERALEAHASRSPPDFWGVTLRNTEDTYFASRESFLALVKRMVEAIRRLSRAPVVMGGVGFSVMPERILAYCGADYGLVREGEVSFPLLLRHLTDGTSPEGVPGLVFRGADGAVRANPPGEADLSRLPPHRRTLVENERYFREGGLAAVETKRGCNRACAYCVEPLVKGRKVRTRPVAHVVDEMESLAARGMDVIHLNDSELNLDLEHVSALCEELCRRGLDRRIRWFAYGMPHPFPEELARLMVRSGCAGMNFGVDSANDDILRAVRRTFRRRHIAETVEVCRRVGLRYMLEILLGFPGETHDTVKDTIRFLQEVDAALVSVTAGLRVFPGTALEEMVRAEGLHPRNPNLHGQVEGNEDLLQPLFYLSSRIGPDPVASIQELIAGDRRFFPLNTPHLNYNSNALLVEAIRGGARGAYWSILEGHGDAIHARGGRAENR